MTQHGISDYDRWAFGGRPRRRRRTRREIEADKAAAKTKREARKRHRENAKIDAILAYEGPITEQLEIALRAVGGGEFPDTVTVAQLVAHAADDEFRARFRRSPRAITQWMEWMGYERKANPDAADGLWWTGGKRQAVYTKTVDPEGDWWSPENLAALASSPKQ